MIKYQEVARNIRKKILNGEYVAGKQLPLEKEMCVYYGVSRITIKRALDELVKQPEPEAPEKPAVKTKK